MPSSIKPEDLLGEIEDILRNLPDLGRIRAGDSTSMSILGRAQAVLQNWNDVRAVSASFHVNDNSHHAEAEKLGRQRNRFLHDPFLMDRDTGVIRQMRVTADKLLVHEFIETEVADLTRTPSNRKLTANRSS